MASPAGGKRPGGQNIMTPGARTILATTDGDNGPSDNANVVGLRSGHADVPMSDGRSAHTPEGGTQEGLRTGGPPAVPATMSKKA